jgi:hypothetical protein
MRWVDLSTTIRFGRVGRQRVTRRHFPTLLYHAGGTYPIEMIEKRDCLHIFIFPPGEFLPILHFDPVLDLQMCAG